MDRRAAFFLVAAFLCALMVPLADQQYRGLAAGLAIAYVVLALASFVDYRSNR